jgi:hypothetical protein
MLENCESTREYADKMLLAALHEAQSAVRSYDTKAQIVGVGYILALNVVLHFGDLLRTKAQLGPLFYAVVWGVVLMPILLFGQVLFPSRRQAENASPSNALYSACKGEVPLAPSKPEVYEALAEAAIKPD